ncbi:S8 family serine peptidase [Actinophytocola sp. NPDC049390]|uniref:S8 family serine peptidase n=1 Tax=Actinophytocola sp. NPDC049390 TaxID=3363894 RepID=UPI0037A51409
MQWRSRALTVALGAVTVLATVSVPTAAAAPAPKPDARGTAVSVTLVTGDVVHLERLPGGRQAATIEPGPGRDHVTFTQHEVDGRLSVLPADVVPQLGDRLDPALFDVTGLVEQGFTGTLPVIVTYADRARRTAPGLDLASINGRATRATPSVLADKAVQHIDLDRRIKVDLEHSVPQIGAPSAWAAGFDGTGTTVAVLDTGYDATHPDLAGVVTAAENFTESPDTTDHFGHGTHVAATVAGTGSASGGQRKGVAPGADVIVGKVLGDDGYGMESWVLAGMEWAARSGAEVVNMSLGGGPTDGTDPLSQAVDALTAETGTLFVVSAGNDGENGASTVGSPGSATAALTVGAVDRDESLAPFSSRGPRVGDLGLKPDITAPGVGIVAARAAGTAMGTPVDDHYTTASGTSMAAPHVAGAAAILAQRHPEWTGQQLKDALVSTAVGDPARSVYEHGGGRVAVDRAVAQGVYADSTVDFGELTEPVTRDVTYVNTTGAPVSLALTTTAPVQLGQSSVEVPAHGTATVPVTADPALVEPGAHGGLLVATSGDVSVRTAVGVVETAPTHEVTFRAQGRDGEDLFTAYLVVYGADQRQDVVTWIPDGGSRTVELPEGVNYLAAMLTSRDVAYQIADPAFEVTGDREYVLDAAKTTRVRVETPQRATQQGIFSFYVHREFGQRDISNYAMKYPNTRELWVSPTVTAPSGVFEFGARWSLTAPPLWADTSTVDFEPRYLGDSPKLDGRRTLEIVPAGDFGPEVRGKVVLVPPSLDHDYTAIAEAAKNAGAVLALLTLPTYGTTAATAAEAAGLAAPVATVRPAEGAALARAIDRGRVPVTLTGTVDSPYLYDVMQVERDRVPREVVHRVSDRNSATVRAEYHESGGERYAKEQRFAWRPWQTTAINQYQRVMPTGVTRTETVTAGATTWQHRVRHYRSWESMQPLAGGLVDTPRTFRAGERLTESWYGPVVRPAIPRGGPESTRDGDVLSVRIPEFVDAAGHQGFLEGGIGTKPDTSSARLYRNGSLLAEAPYAWGTFGVPAGEATYRLELSTGRSTPEWQYATATETAWTFRSGHTEHALLPLLQVDYDVDTDLTDRANRTTRLALTFRHQDGLPAPHIRTAQAWLSYDDGHTWTPVRLDRHHRATVHHPQGKTSATLKITATDQSGNKIEQTITRAHAL